MVPAAVRADQRPGRLRSTRDSWHAGTHPVGDCAVPGKAEPIRGLIHATARDLAWLWPWCGLSQQASGVLDLVRVFSIGLWAAGTLACEPATALPGPTATGELPPITATAASNRPAAEATPRFGALLLTPVTITPRISPLAGFSTAKLDQMLRTRPHVLGSASIGEPHRGGLFNGQQLAPSAKWHVVDPDRSWATSETIGAIARSIELVHQLHPGSPKLCIGDMSRRRGGYLRPHRSHQSGRDADLGYYYTAGQAWYVPATTQNLDSMRTWTLVKALLSSGEVEYLFMDHSIQALLRTHAEAAGDDPEWLQQLFRSRLHRDAPVRHSWGHRTHFHVRFHSPLARATARHLHPRLRANGMI